jgi:urea transporter
MGSDDVGNALTSKAMAIACVLSALTGCVHMACKHLTRLPELTLAFNICIALFLFMLTDRRVTLTGLRWGTVDPDFIPEVSDYWTSDNLRFFYDAAIRGVGQFIFIGSTTGGWMVVTGIAISSRPGAMTAVLGAFTACVSARYIYDVPKTSLVAVHNGIYGYSAAGTCASLGGGVFYKHTFPAVVVGVLGAMFTCFVQLAVEAMLKVDNLPFPSLTIPFVSTTWFMMLMRSGWLEPILSKEDEANLNVPLGDSWKSRESNYFIPTKEVLPTTAAEQTSETS